MRKKSQKIRQLIEDGDSIAVEVTQFRDIPDMDTGTDEVVVGITVDNVVYIDLCTIDDDEPGAFKRYLRRTWADVPDPEATLTRKEDTIYISR